MQEVPGTLPMFPDKQEEVRGGLRLGAGRRPACSWLSDTGRLSGAILLSPVQSQQSLGWPRHAPLEVEQRQDRQLLAEEAAEAATWGGLSVPSSFQGLTQTQSLT